MNPDKADDTLPEDQMPGEPTVWHNRLLTFLELGTTRTIKAVYESISGKKVRSIPKTYRMAAKKWQWIERAEKFDAQMAVSRTESLRPAKDVIKTSTEETLRNYNEIIEDFVTAVRTAKTNEDLDKLNIMARKVSMVVPKGHILRPMIDGYLAVFGSKVKTENTNKGYTLAVRDKESIDEMVRILESPSGDDPE